MTKPEDDKLDQNHEKIRLLVLASTYPRWPDDHEPNFVHRLCQELSDHYDITVLTSRSPGSNSVEFMGPVHVNRFPYAPRRFETLIYGGGILTNLRRSPLKWLLVPLYIGSMYFSTRKILNKAKPDLIHCHWIIPQGIVVWLLSLTYNLPPVLVTSHGGDLFSLRGRIGCWMKKKVLSKADAVTVVSSPMKLVAENLGAKPNSLFIAPMGFGFPTDSQAANSKIERKPDRILFVGRLVEKKGLNYLIDALPKILRSRSRAELVVIGDGPERATLEAQVNRLGLSRSVQFLGALPQSDLPYYYQSASLFCAPFVEARNGDIEGLGLVTLEAMSFSCPVLIGNVAATSDVIPSQFSESCLVNPKDSAALANQVIRKLESSKLDQETAALKEHATRQFSWDTVKNRYHYIIGQFLANPQSHEQIN